MPQVFQVLRCYKCLAFQVHQVKKSNKWECKLCGEKQSLKRHYGIGTGKECRLHVQKLNEIRGEKIEQDVSYKSSDDNFDKNSNSTKSNFEEVSTRKQSKWSNYVEETAETNASSEDENDTLFGKEVLLEIPKKRQKLYTNWRNKIKAHKTEVSEEIYEDVSSNTVALPVSNEITTIHKQRKKFIPPTNKTKSKWSEYVSENIENHTDGMYSPHFSNKHIEATSSILASPKTKNYLKSNTPALNVTNNSTNKEFNTNIFNTDVGNKSINNSKWFEFMDNTESEHETNCLSSQDFDYVPDCTTKPNNLFSLCNENDLDSILDV